MIIFLPQICANQAVQRSYAALQNMLIFVNHLLTV